MRVNQVILIPAFSNDGNLGRYHFNACEYDAMAAYFEPLCEHLDNDRVSFLIQKPEDSIFPNSMVLYCGIGWESKNDKIKSNYSQISYCQQTSRRLCDFFMESASEWGRCYVSHGHKTREMSKAKHSFLDQPNTYAISIEPFKVNGEFFDEYIRHASVLGQMMANTIREFITTKEDAPARSFASAV